MAARWGRGDETLTLGGMELFSASSALQCHTLAEDEICAGLPDLSLSLDTGEILGTFQGCVDPSIISIIDDSSSQGELKGRFEDNELSLLTALTEILDNADDQNVSPFDTITDVELLASPKDRENSLLQKFLSLSRSPVEREVLSSDNQWGLRTNGNYGTIGKVENHSADESWDVFPICLDNSPPKRCSKSRSMRKCARPRIPEGPTQQRSDGEEEEIHSSKQDCNSEADRDFVDIGMEFSADMINDNNLQTKLKSGQRTPCVFNTEKVTLCDLVKYMHSYCLPTIAVCLETESEEINEEFLNNAVVLEIMADGDDAAMPVVVQLSEQGIETEEPKNSIVNGTSLLTGGSSIQAYGSGMKHGTALQENETEIPELPQQVESDVDGQKKPVTLTLVQQDKMSLQNINLEVQLGGNSLKSELDVEYKTPLLPMEPEIQAQQVFVKNKSEVQHEASCQHIELRTLVQETFSKCEPRIESEANFQSAGPEEKRKIKEGKIKQVKICDEHGNVHTRGSGLTRKQQQQNATENVQICERSRSRVINKRKNKGAQNRSKLKDGGPPKSSTSLQENVDSKNKLKHAGLLFASHVNGSLLQESDFLVRHLEKVKKESEMELRSIRACRVKGRAKANMESSLLVSPQDRKAPLENKKDPKQSDVRVGFVKSDLVSKEAKRPSDRVLMKNKEQTASENMIETELLMENRIDKVPKSDVHQESNVSDEVVHLAPSKEVRVVIEDNGLLEPEPTEDLNTMQPPKDTKPKSLSLKEYRMRMQQRKLNAEERTENEKSATNKWPSVPEPPTELAEIPCLLVTGTAAGSLLTKPIQTKIAPVVEKICTLDTVEKIKGSSDSIPLVNSISELPPKIASEETSKQKQADYSSPASLGVAHFSAPYTHYANPPTWHGISAQSVTYPCLPPLPVVPGINSACPPNTFKPVSLPPPPLPAMPASTWPPPPFVPPPPIGACGAPGWGACLPPPYWPTTPVPSVIVNDGSLPLENPAKISFPVDSSQSTPFQTVDCARNNIVNVSSTENLLQHEQQMVTFQEGSVLAHKVQSFVASNQNKQVQIVQEARNHNASEEKHMGTVEGKVESIQSIQMSCSLKEEVNINSENPTTGNISRPIGLINESGFPKASMESFPGKVATSKEPVPNLVMQPYTTGSNVLTSHVKSENNVVFRIMELLKKMSKRGVSAESHTTQGTMTHVSDALQLNPAALAIVTTKSQCNLEAAVPAEPQTNPGAMVAATVIPPKPVTTLGVMTSAPAKFLTTLGITLPTAEAPAKPLTTLGATMPTAAAPAKPLTTLGATVPTAVAPAKPLTTLGATMTTMTAPVKPLTTLGVKTTVAVPAKPLTVASVHKSTGLKKSQKDIRKRKDMKQNIVQELISEIGIEASDLTSLLEQFEESEAKEVCHTQSPANKLAIGNSGLESQGEKKPCNKLLAPELASTAGLTPPATPPHQLWKPLAATSLLRKAKPLNTASQEGIGNSPVKSTKLIEAKPLPQNKTRNRNSLSIVAPVHVAHGDHDYCFLGISQTKKGPDVSPPVAEATPQQLNTQLGKGTRLNIKHHQTITIKPIMSLKERLQSKQVTVAGCSLDSANHCSENAFTHHGEHVIRNDCTDQLDHRTSEKNDVKLGKNHPESVLLSPESSPCRSDDVEVRRTRNLHGNDSVSKRSLCRYRKRRHSPSPQASSWRSRRAHTSRSCSSGSDSDSELSSSSSSSSRGSRSRSRSTSTKRRRRYHSRSSCSSRFSSRSSLGSRSRSRGRSSSASSSSRSYSTSYSRSRSRSRSPYSRHHGRCSRRYRFYDSRTSYQREKLYHKERAIEERRVVYIGKIHSRMTRSELKHRFSVFGDIEDCTIHFREKGDNYGFVTYRYTEEAFTALENGHKLQYPGELPFDLCFGGRRQFCKGRYADLDSNKDDFDPARMKNKFDSLDFDTLLKQAQKSHRR